MSKARALLTACFYLLISIFLLISQHTWADEIKKAGSCTVHEPVIFGILPFVSAEQLVARFAPLAQYLQNNLQVPVRIETAPDFAEFVSRTHQQRYDILFTAPHFFSQASHEAGYRLLVSVDSPGMTAVIVVPAQSDIKQLSELKGKRLATVQPMSLSAQLTIRLLAEHGIKPHEDLELVTTPTHDASLLSAYHGVTDVAALMRPPFEAFMPKVRQQMRIIAETEKAPHIPISASQRLNKKCADEIKTVLLNMNQTETGKTALKKNHFSGFRQAQVEEYEQFINLPFQESDESH